MTDSPSSPDAPTSALKAVALPDGRRLPVYGAHSLEETAPLAVYDAGAFGIYADGASVIASLHARGWSAISFTRSGLYGADPLAPGQQPTPSFHAEDFASLLAAVGLGGRRIVLIAHSMGGLRAHAFAKAYPERLAGLVLLDAMTPQQLHWPIWRESLRALARTVDIAAASVDTPVASPLVNGFPNGMDLEGQALKDKRASFLSARHLRASRQEVLSALTKGAVPEGALPSGLPVLVTTTTAISRGTAALLEKRKSGGERVAAFSLPGHWNGHIAMLNKAGGTATAEAVVDFFQDELSDS